MRIRVVPIIGALLICLAAAPRTYAQDVNGHFESAMTAVEEERWDEALNELELAYREDPSTVVTYWRIVVLEKSGHPQLALELLRENRDALLDEPEATDLAVLEERLRSEVSNADSDPDPNTAETNTEATTAETSETTTVSSGRPILGPVLLGTLGLASGGVAVYGLAAPNCTSEALDGTCLEGTRTSAGPTVAYAAVGIGALAGAILWHTLGGKRERSAWRFTPSAGSGALGAVLSLSF
jgi:hypothetical protein